MTPHPALRNRLPRILRPQGEKGTGAAILFSATAYRGFSRQEASFNQATRAKIYASACW